MAADYTMTAELLAAQGILQSVAEIHGVLCGQICADHGDLDLQLSRQILELNDDIPPVIGNLLEMLAADIRSQLELEDFSFQPLLPDDDEELSLRLTALASWCDGFNAGFAGAWVRDDGAMSEETREVLGDFSRVAQAEDSAGVSESGEDEIHFMEILEYVRMAAITVYLQNRNAGAVATVPADGNIH
jgi:uncharacterized protein YgfB (UPF0149 family)